MTRPQEIAGLGEIADRYDVFLFDQYGVLHDGQRLYDQVLPVLLQLARRGARSIVVTNSGKRAAANRDRLLRLSLDRSLFLDVVSSGEVAWRGIRDGAFGDPFRTCRRVCIVGRAGDDYGFDELGLVSVDVPEQSEFVLFLGSNAPATSLDDYARLLRPAAEAGLPALCCNPDRLMLTARGPVAAPGAIADLYSSLGGPVRWIGKPFREIYQSALELAGHPPPACVLAIGDSIDHDIAGAATISAATALVRSGVSADLSVPALMARDGSAGDTPDWILKELRW
jgi:HAD superfamily hydrolase (TIGR01459 family)